MSITDACRPSSQLCWFPASTSKECAHAHRMHLQRLWCCVCMELPRAQHRTHCAEGVPLFRAECELAQISCIINVLGSYRPERWGCAELLPDYSKIVLADSPGIPLSSLFPDATQAALDVLSALLSCVPTGAAFSASMQPSASVTPTRHISCFLLLSAHRWPNPFLQIINGTPSVPVKCALHSALNACIAMSAQQQGQHAGFWPAACTLPIILRPAMGLSCSTWSIGCGLTKLMDRMSIMVMRFARRCPAAGTILASALLLSQCCRCHTLLRNQRQQTISPWHGSCRCTVIQHHDTDSDTATAARTLGLQPLWCCMFTDSAATCRICRIAPAKLLESAFTCYFTNWL
jgi:hypothetical protein